MKVVRCSWSLPNEDKESLNGPHTKILEKKKRKTMRRIKMRKMSG